MCRRLLEMLAGVQPCIRIARGATNGWYKTEPCNWALDYVADKTFYIVWIGVPRQAFCLVFVCLLSQPDTEMPGSQCKIIEIGKVRIHVPMCRTAEHMLSGSRGGS